MDLVELDAPQFFNDYVGDTGFRVWHIMFACLGVLILIVVMLCCCFRFRIPRTKQEIEADFQRRKLAKKFRQRLAHIKNTEMNEMDLNKALERVRLEFLAEAEQKCGEDKKLLENDANNMMKV